MAQIGFQISMLPVGSIQSLAEYIEIIPGVIAIKTGCYSPIFPPFFT
jgi:hypothetical protein